MWQEPRIAFVNARVFTPSGEASSIRFGRRVLDLDARPRPHDVVVDLDGAFVLPGLINAHDHLELNHYGRIKERDRYTDVAEWIDDMAIRLRCDEGIRRNQRLPLQLRLLAGAMKNLLSGVTTVAHHNPLYRELRWRFPVQVVKRYGWAHSFLLQHRPVGAKGELGGDVRTRYTRTSRHAPFLMHLAEGTAVPAREEFHRLESCRCVGPNTVMVHGIALDAHAWRRARTAGASLVWCPASNLFLFGRTAPIRSFLDLAPDARRHVALGSDSRLTGAADLLDELRVAAGTGEVSADDLLPMVTTAAADVLKLTDVGRLGPGARADLIVVPNGKPSAPAALLATHRSDIEGVVLGGRMVVASPKFAPAFAQPIQDLRVDGVRRIASASLCATLSASPIHELGVEWRS